MLAIIPARGGSKGVPRKNIKALAGRPLIDYAIKAACAARTISRVLVSTEDKEIAEVALSCGAEVPFLRPVELATDTVPNGVACLHMIDELMRCEGVSNEAFALIQATNPFVSSDEFDGAISLFTQRLPAAVVSVSKFEVPIEAVFQIAEDGHLRSVLKNRYGVDFTPGTRQSYGERFVVSGAITVVKTALMRGDPNYYFRHPDTLAFRLNDDSGIDIDTPLDFALAELIARRRAESGHQTR